MASGYSQPGSTYRHLNPIDVFDEQLVATVLGAKQQRYDANVAKIDAAIQQYGNIDLLRAQDKEYLNKKLSYLTNDINNAGTQDLSSSSVTRNIMKHIDQAQDDYVIEQSVNTAKFRQFQEEVEEYKKKGNGELYAKQNEAYALYQAGYGEYMKGDKNTLGSLEYNPYVDVAEIQREILENVASNKHGITRKVPTQDGYMIESENYGMTPQEVRRNVETSLNPQQQKQLEINAWAKYGQNAEKAYEAYLQPKVESLQEERVALMLDYDGKTDAEKAIVDEKVAYLDSTVKYITSKKESPSALFGFLGREDLISSLSAHYTPTETGFKYSSDASYYKELDLIADRMESQGNSQGGLKDDFNQNHRPDLSERSLETGTEEQNYVASKNSKDEVQMHEDALRNTYNSAYNRLDAEGKEEFNTAYKHYLKTTGVKDSAANKAIFMLDNSNQGKGSYMTAAEVAEAQKQKRDYLRKKNILVDSHEEALEEVNAVALETVFRGLKDGTENENIKVTDVDGRVVSGRDFLRGVEKLEDLPEDKKQALLRSVRADLAISQLKDHQGDFYGKTTFNIESLAKINGETNKDLPMLIDPSLIIHTSYTAEKFQNNFGKLKKDMQLPPSLTKEQFVEHIMPLVEQDRLGILSDFEDASDFLGVRNFVRTTGLKVAKNMLNTMGFNSVEDAMVIGGEGTKTRAALETALANGTYDKASWTDDSVEDDVTMRRALSNQDEYTKRYEKKVADKAPYFDQNKIVVIEPSKGKGREVPAFGEIMALAGGDFDSNKHVNLKEGETGDYYLAFQTDETITASNSEEVIKMKSKYHKIYKRDIFNNPNSDLAKWISRNGEVQRVNVENTKELASGKIGFADGKDQRKYVTEVGKMFGANSEKDLEIYTAQGAKNMLFDTHQTLFDPTTPSGKKHREFAEAMIDNSHLFRIKMEANDFGRYDLAIQYQKGDDWKNLRSVDTRTSDITNAVDKIDVAPQIFLYDYMNKLFTKIRDKGSESVKDEMKILQNLIYPQ